MLTTSLNSVRRFAMFFSPTHEWVDVEGKIGKIGISAYAVSNLGDVNAIDVPLPKVLKAGDDVGNIEATKAVTPFMAPVSGKVFEINSLVSENPKLVNQSPEKDGWIAKIEISDETELSKLMSTEAYKKFLKNQ